MIAVDTQTTLAHHIREYANALSDAADNGALALALASELMGSEHVASVDITPVGTMCRKVTAVGWDGPLLTICILPSGRLSISTESQRVAWETLPQHYASEVARNLVLMSP